MAAQIAAPYVAPDFVYFLTSGDTVIFFFIAMVIFLPQGLLGFAKRWLNK